MEDPQSSTEHRDRWIDSKQLTPELAQKLSAIRESWARAIEEKISMLSRAKSDLVFAKSVREVYAAVDKLAEASRGISHESHGIKFLCDWFIPPMPEFQDQFINQHYLLREFKRTFWLEGAVLCGLGIKSGGRILELCCGSGWYTDQFYSPFASEIVAVDFDPRAIEMAQRFHKRPNIRYEVMDIRETFPKGPFETVIWDGAIEHFTVAEIDEIMGKMRQAITTNARLLGYTVAEPANAPHLLTHETHFEGIAHLGGLLKQYFKNVRVFERIHPTIQPPRHNLFFYASNGSLPFDKEWEHGLRL